MLTQIQKIALLLPVLMICTPMLSQFGEGEHQSGNKHMAAHHYTVVCTGNDMPSSAILTYPVNEFRVQDYNFLVKLMPSMVKRGEIILPSMFEQTEVQDFPGGVEAKMVHKNSGLQTRITPLLIGRGNENWQGAVLYEVKSENGEDVLVHTGGGETINLIWGFENSIMKKDSVAPLEEFHKTGGSSFEFVSGKEDLNLGLITSGTLEGSVIRFSGGRGHMLVAWAEKQGELGELLSLDPWIEKQRVRDYYESLLESSIETPEKLMDDAFASAIYNLEYNWLEPFGWGECLHHWLALWYMQVTAAADWIGQTDRSRSSILMHGEQRLENGAIPMFNPNHLKQGMKRRDWGGANNFWVWQLRHYLKMTGDKEFAWQVIPMVEDCIRQSMEEYDPDGNLLLAWGLQIGNQEDFVANPWDGAVPSMELYNMFQTLAELYEFTGQETNASSWHTMAAQVKDALYRELWQKDLGRFAYYKDPTEKLLPDGQYQTYLYPAIYEIVDEYDQYSGLRHLMDRLMDKEGSVFASNNFPFHVPESVSTWGMQRGAAQQPWAAMGYSAMGMNELTWKPLKAMAAWAQDPRREGAWPETGPEPTPAYFTPPAGLYISTIIEALFGINKDVPGGFMTLRPSFPEHWPEASLNLPGLKLDYSRKKNLLEYRIRSEAKLPLKVRWALPVGSIKKCQVDKKDVEYTLEAGIRHMVLCFEVPDALDATISIEYQSLKYELEYPPSVCEGEQVEIKLEGARIQAFKDRSGILESVSELGSSGISGKVSSGLIQPYMKYGRLGQLNFSRRTFFLDCISTEGTPFIVPVDLCILPRWEAAVNEGVVQKGGKLLLPFTLRNNLKDSFSGDIKISFANKTESMHVELEGRSQKGLIFTLPPGQNTSQGENTAHIILPEGSVIALPFRDFRSRGNSVFRAQPLPENELIPDKNWFDLRIMPGYPHIFFTFSPGKIPEPMEALEGVSNIKVKQVPGLEFSFTERHFLPLSHLSGKSSCRIEIEKGTYKKLYVLLLPLVDNHDIFSEVARITAFSGITPKYSRTLCYPGDLDYWVSNRNPTSFATLREARENPHELLPLLEKDQADWAIGKPPAFPQSRWWSTSIPLEYESCVLSVIEIDPGRPVELDHLVVESIGSMPAMGVVAVSGELSE